MGQTGLRKKHLNYNLILSLFTATVVFVVFLLVSYIIVTPCCIEHHHLASDRPREVKFLRRRTKDNEGSLTLSAVKQSKNKKVSGKKWTAEGSDRNLATLSVDIVHRNDNFMSLIPTFKQGSGPSLLHDIKNSPRQQKNVIKHTNSSLVQATHCSDNICSEYLSIHDRSRYYSCLDYASRTKKVIPLSSPRCKFINGTDRDPVALISLPGSGNTWVRAILESITGICTGAVYCDISLRYQGFIGEHIRGGSVLVVKSHEISPLWTDSRNHLKPLQENRGQFGSAVFIVRNPLNAIVAEWNRKVANNFTIRTTNLNSHTQSVGKEWFGENELWQEFVVKHANRWKAMLRNWVINNRNHPVLVVNYELLQNNTIAQSKRILEFLGINYNTLEVEKVITDDVKTFHRNHTNQFEHYTSFQRSFVQSIVNDTVQLLEKSDLSDVIDIKDYLQ